MITFDFDNTLCAPVSTYGYWTTDGVTPNEKVIPLVHKHAAEGHEIHLVTARFDSNDSRYDIAKFIENNKLPISEVHFTNNKIKAPLLEQLGSEKHYDDDVEECIACQHAGIPVVLVLHPTDEKNCTTDLFECL